MGAGKTSWALDYINNSYAYKKFIYITPFLKEITRIRETVTNRTFYEPNNDNKEGRKLRSLKELIISGRDICATHSLFQMADDELIELLTDSGYTLILDEVMDVIEKAPISGVDIKALLDLKYIEVVNNRVIWLNDEYIGGRFDDIRLLAKAGNLFYHRGKFLIWSFPPQVFKAFNEVIVMTYLFDAQIQRYYYDLYNIQYEFKSVKKIGDKYEIVDYIRGAENRKEIMKLIHLYEGKLNNIGERNNALSATWLRRAGDDVIEQLQKNTYNFFYNICKTKAKENLWTTIKDRQPELRGKGYAKSFIPLNMRATNDYESRKALAYLFNRYMNPIERAFFEDNGINVNQDLLAVSDLLQWVWRSRIRNREPIQLYLPSSRMRGLLKAWGKDEI